jgi:hypothetical protein
MSVTNLLLTGRFLPLFQAFNLLNNPVNIGISAIAKIKKLWYNNQSDRQDFYTGRMIKRGNICTILMNIKNGLRLPA